MHQSLRSFPRNVCYKYQRKSLLCIQRDNAAPPALPHLRRLQTCAPPGACVLNASRPAAPFTERLTMAQAPPPDPEIATWLHTLGVTFLCQWEVLVFLYKHQPALLAVVDLARLLGYPSHAMVIALDSLEALELVARSRVSQGARLYQFSVPLNSPRGAAFLRLYTLANHPAGLARVAQHVRRGHTPQEALHQAQRFAADAQQHLQVIRREADERAAWRNRWL